MANKMQPVLVCTLRGAMIQSTFPTSPEDIASLTANQTSLLGDKGSSVHVMCLCPQAPGLRCQGYGHQRRNNKALRDGHFTT